MPVADPAVARDFVTAGWRQELAERGFFVTPPLVGDADLDPVRAEFLRLWTESLRVGGAGAAGTGNDLARLAFMSELHRRSAILARFCRHPALVGLARAVLGVDDRAGLEPDDPEGPARREGVRVAPGRAVTDPIDPGITLWLAVTRTTLANGALRVLPGAHHAGLLPHDWDEAGREWRCRLDVDAGIVCELAPGQAIVFGRLLPHASGANTSDEVRMAYQLGYQPLGVRVVEVGGGAPVLGDRVPVMRAGRLVG